MISAYTEKIVVLISIVIVGAIAFASGRSSVNRGIDQETVHNMLRAAGDSAVTEFRSSAGMEEFVADVLADTVEYYTAEVQAATKIVIRRDTIRITGERVEVPVQVSSTDTVTVALPDIRQSGIYVSESLSIYPPPQMMDRSIDISFDPDTLMVALLETEEGISRFSAAAMNAGIQTRVIDAAQVRQQDYSGVKSALTVVTMAACIVTGYTIADENWKIAAVAGSTCGGGSVIRFFF